MKERRRNRGSNNILLWYLRNDCVAHEVMCTVHFCRGIPPSTEKLLQLYYLSFNSKRIKCLKFSFDVDVANGVAIDVANDVLPAW